MNGVDNIPLKWIFWLSAIVILASITNAIVILFFFPNPSIVQYRITVALVCFALSSVAGLLFASQVQLTGTIGVLTITLGGTAALWLAALLIFNQIYPEKSLPSISTIENMPITGKITKEGNSSNDGIVVGVIPGRYKTFTNTDGTYRIEVTQGEHSYIGLAYLRNGEEREFYIGDVQLGNINGNFNHIFGK